MRTLVTSYLLATLASVGLANANPTAPIPAEVIQQCTSQSDASRMPACLNEGAFGHFMLHMATQPELYGSDAQPVVSICLETNTDYQSAWTCFEMAAKNATETRNLIGVEKIEDSCVAAISDPTTYANLTSAAATERKRRFPDEFFSGGSLYHPFKGCPLPSTADGNDRPSQTAATTDQSVDQAVDAAGRCIALRDLERVVRENDTELLMAAMDKEKSGLAGLQELGLAKSSLDYIQSASEADQPALGFLVAAMLFRYHPDMVEDLGEQDLSSPFATALLSAPLEQLDRDCPAR